LHHEEHVWKIIEHMFQNRKSDISQLEFMAKYKFDSYEGYRTGDRFASNLLRFLQNFKDNEKDLALDAVTRIVFISAKEMHELSMELYYKIKLRLLDLILDEKSDSIEAWDYAKAYDKYYQEYLAKSLFIGLSDSSKIDYFRRHAQVDNESIVSTYKIDVDDLIKAGKENEERNPNADYQSKENIFLIDDFSGSGYTFLRQLGKFHERWYNKIKYKRIFFCPYVITTSALENIWASYEAKIKTKDVKFEIMGIMEIPHDHALTKENCVLFEKTNTTAKMMLDLCGKYYDDSIEDVHTRKNRGVKYGFGETGLLLVKYDNCPNDSIYPIWYKDYDRNTALKDWSPLFPRIPRHKNLK
jgi:hypothetical protein